MSRQPEISVCITVYNLEQYISQTIESVLWQRTSYLYEIIIVDDASSDNSPNIIKDFRNKYPDIIKVFFNEHNLKYAKTYLKALSLCNGKYIAVLDGDDYWTNTNKLQIQVDFLEKNPEFAFTHHNGLVLNINGDSKEFKTTHKKSEYTITELLNDANNWNSSVVYRNIYKSSFPDWLEFAIHPDYPLHLLHAKKGQIKYFNEIMGVYRIHGNNISNFDIKKEYSFIQNSIWVMKSLRPILGIDLKRSINLIISRLYDILAGKNLKKKKYIYFIKFLICSYWYSPFRTKFEYKESFYHIFKQ